MTNGMSIIGHYIFHQFFCLPMLFKTDCRHGNKDKEGQSETMYKWKKSVQELQEGKAVDEAEMERNTRLTGQTVEEGRHEHTGAGHKQVTSS